MSAVKKSAEKKSKPKETEVVVDDDRLIVKELKELYSGKLLEIEKKTLFHKFHSPEMLPSEIASKPTVLLLGQYSVGKTSFIRHLLGMDYPGMHIGPEPTTDRFIAVVHGENERVIKGNALTGVVDLPFSGLSTFGSGFLNKFEAAIVNSPFLKQINIIDTPGVLSGEKQRVSRGYDFAKVSKWFAERSDLILLLFDAHKLDISDEFKGVMEELHPHEDKVRCVLNKCDSLSSPESLMRVYGALLWSMGKIFRGAEVTRIYVGSFDDQEIVHKAEFGELFEKDHAHLLAQLKELPSMCCMRKVNEMVKRIRLCVVHACVLGLLRSKMPLFMGAEQTRAGLIKNLDKVFEEVRNLYHLSEGDFPNIDEFRGVLQRMDFYTFPAIDRAVLNQLQDMLSTDIPHILSHVSGATGGAVGGARSEDDGSGARLQMFSIDEDGENGSEKGKTMSEMVQSQQIMAVVIATLVVVIGLIVASVAEDHVTAQFISRAVAQAVTNLLVSFKGQSAGGAVVDTAAYSNSAPPIVVNVV